MKERFAWIFILGLAPMVARGESSTTQPSVRVTTEGPTTRHGSAQAGRGFWPAMGPQRFGRLEGVTPAEWESTQAFMKEHSPQRLKFIDSLPNGPRRTGLIGFAVRSFRNYEYLQSSDQELAQVNMSRIELEDEIFGTVNQLKKTNPGADAVIREKLHQKVAALVDVNIKERELRIARLKKTLESEQDRLTADAGRRDELVEDRFDRILKESQRFGAATEASQNEVPPAIPPAK